MKRIGLVAAGMMLLAPSAVAQTAEEEVEQVVQTWYQSLRDGDAATYASLWVSGDYQYADNFNRDGTLRGTPAPVTDAFLQAFFDAGGSYQLSVRNLDVAVYGNAAVATFYTVGPSNFPDGTVLDGTFRVTIVFIRQGQAWKGAHYHVSPLETMPLRTS